MTPPCKPEVCIVDGRLAVFMGGAYQMMTLERAEPFVKRLQGELAKLQRQVKRAKRAAAKAAPPAPVTSVPHPRPAASPS